tara:strand:- start:540 stop:1004 length:465 start_codon:yes stop_codon:yes gene_type:complete
MLSFLVVFLSFSVKNVYLHMEKFNERFNLLHTGISFSDKYKTVRYDFRPFSAGGSYETNLESRLDSEALFPTFPTNEEFGQHREELETKKIKWGETKKTWKEISEFEIESLCTKRYIIGVYDCRHYTRDFTRWCCNNQTPVWNLDVLWNQIQGS